MTSTQTLTSTPTSTTPKLLPATLRNGALIALNRPVLPDDAPAAQMAAVDRELRVRVVVYGAPMLAITVLASVAAVFN